jgi:hypothetical protein
MIMNDHLNADDKENHAANESHDTDGTDRVCDANSASVPSKMHRMISSHLQVSLPVSIVGVEIRGMRLRKFESASDRWVVSICHRDSTGI